MPQLLVDFQHIEMICRKILILCMLIGIISPILCYGIQRFGKTQYVEVPLDHFSYANNRTFKLRYFFNDTYWDRHNGPILFYTGNQASVEFFANHTGYMWKLAPELKALIVFAEHRYYGQSLPFGKKSFDPENIGYLTISQTLADYVDVISYLKKDRHFDDYNPVIAIGGSYGGMLSAYMRMKYPHIVVGALSSSAPMLLFQDMTPCDAFYSIVSKAFENKNKNCSDNIRRSWAAIGSMHKSTNGRRWLSKQFNLCQELKEGDLKEFKLWLVSIYTHLAAVDYPYEYEIAVPLPANPVYKTCLPLNSIKHDKKLHLLKKISEAVSIFTNSSGTKKCNKVEMDYAPDVGLDAWDYQSCTELKMAICSTGSTDMFERQPWNEKEFQSTCLQDWNIRYDAGKLLKEYGGNDLHHASNIIFSNSLLDPWAAGGIMKKINKSIKVIQLPLGGHHFDLMDDNKNDPDSVIRARNFYTETIKSWIESAHIQSLR